MDQVIENEFNNMSLMDGDSQLNVGIDDEVLADSTEEETARYEKLIRELDEFEEACKISTNSTRPLQQA